MDASEGLKRIAQVIRWLGYFIAGLCVIGAINGSSPEFFLIIGAIFGGLGWSIGWIIDGFAKNK